MYKGDLFTRLYVMLRVLKFSSRKGNLVNLEKKKNYLLFRLVKFNQQILGQLKGDQFLLRELVRIVVPLNLSPWFRC